MFSWWCVWVSVRRFFCIRFGGPTGFFNVIMQNVYFVFAAALLHEVDIVMFSMQKNEVLLFPTLFPSTT